MTRAGSWLYRLRALLVSLIYVLGFWAPWERYGRVTFAGSTVWTALPAVLFRQRWMDFSTAARLLLVLATILSVLAAALRIWAASYTGISPVRKAPAPAVDPVADGPYRYVRHPMALGLILHALALSILMPPSGAVVALVLLGLLVAGLVRYEEVLARTRQEQVYATYIRAVPLLLPSPRPRVPTADDRPRWGIGLLSEVFFWGTAGGFLVEGASYNGTRILRWVLVALGLQIITLALRGTSPLQLDSGSR